MHVRASRSPAPMVMLALLLCSPARGAADGAPTRSPLSAGPPPNGEIAGRVADAAGTPLEGVEVSVWGPTLPLPRVASPRSPAATAWPSCPPASTPSSSR